ncbi:uncharacterized protein LOC111268227 [Varroa jacobsoni]|uniref:C2H2-type domain-containing protein n=1 Tax=Varroa destructor TaxID=109461 RepID=A0A7M7MD05_VARDE|nr:uncharacterized protein LOC111252539 [Varroa destructor]XP_022667319.1 uncharacterized protein LOC111252922 [Varroa destructor]XP_022702813.1 uncharacterized protein LOC111268227 [Varroa jacobsoni]
MTEFGMRSFTVQGQRKNSTLYVHPEGPYKLQPNQELQYGKFLMEKNAVHRTHGGAVHIYTHCYTFRKKCPARAVFTADNVVVKNGNEPHNHEPVEDEVDQFRLLMELRKAQQICNGNQEIVYKCELCSKMFSHKKTLLAHYRSAHRVEPSNADGTQQNFKCVHCDNAVFATLTRLRSHYVDTHQFNPETQELEFPTLAEFENWRRHMESETGLRMRRRWGSRKRKDGSVRFRFSCSRNDPLRKGIIRVNFAWCPAEMKVVKDGGLNSRVKVEWNSSHYGHDLDHLTLLADTTQEQEVVERAEVEEITEEQPMEEDQGVTTVMQMVPEEAIGTEDSAILLQDDTQPEPTAIEHVTGEDSLIEEAEETRQLIEDPNTCEAPVLEPKLQRAVSSMCAQVGITQTAVRQGGTLRGDQQVEAVSKMNDLLQLMVNVQLKSADYEQVHKLMDAILIVYKRRLHQQETEHQGEAIQTNEHQQVIQLEDVEGGQLIVIEDADVQQLYADHSYSTQDGETTVIETENGVAESILEGGPVHWEIREVECVKSMAPTTTIVTRQRASLHHQ